ncbi:hypothetical protein HJ50_24325 [Salmonella enterica subsp. enterica serovar Muenchen]|nr:hypothetical protein [Salmonella enterica subsp. enterica serovar Muenchen]
MNKVHLSEYAKNVGQERAAASLGVRQGAISKALKSGRTIYVIISPDGTVAAEEVRSFPSTKKEPSVLNTTRGISSQKPQKGEVNRG